jgi:16S rRNA pseudouridine516 synthase
MATRLDELLAKNLGISKTAVAGLVAAGRVTDDARRPIGDRKLAIPRLDPPRTVHLDDEPVALFDEVLVMLHKPRGVVTALRDSRHPTAYALLHDAPLFAELRAVGRLDLDTSGLLLWTTEGGLIQRLTHPKRRVPRTYHAALTGAFVEPAGNFALEDGHRPEITALTRLARSDVNPALNLPAEAQIFASITVVGGAYHEVRRIFAALGSHVVGLCRTQFGDYSLPADLPAGDWRRLALPAPLTA